MAIEVEDTDMGAYVYCTQHMRVHATGWCTVSASDKLPLEAKDKKGAFEEAKSKGYVRPDGEGVLFHFDPYKQQLVPTKR